jgi:HD-GYP domain-containing protein (c-di-GMP phosphodiesterase class II)
LISAEKYRILNYSFQIERRTSTKGADEMECTQAEAFEQYIRDLRVVRSISRPSFPEGKAPTAVLEEIQTNALRCNALMRQNEALLAQLVYDRDPASLTETDIQGLSAFAGRLFNYANSEDMGVAFKVHQLLLAAARSREDVPMIVRELYYTGITLHYMNVRDEGTGINLLGDAIQVYFTEAAEYMSRYEQLDRNTRQYLIRCVGNTRLGMSRGTHAESCRYLERFRRAMDIIQSAHYHALDPEFPWESYIYSMHMDRMTLLTHLRQEEDPEVARQVLESAGSVAQDDYSAEAINRKLVLAAYLSVYAERLDEAGAQRYRATVEQVRRSADQYLEQMPASQYPRVVNSAAWELSKINTSSDETANRRMLGSILAGHKPTYVHSLMVAELTRALLQRQIETRPETLVGLLGCRSAAEVQARREELCQTAYECGLYHDLGKCAVLMYIDNNARRLLDEEFFCIQSHPRTGADILNRMGCGRTLALAALYHHCYYNGKGGYPNDVPSCPPEIKGIVDALSVADSLDAATDNIGRCYNLAKPFRTLLEELRAQSGTRYAPNVVALFEDERFCQQLAENTDAERKRVYLQVYHAGSEEK